MTPQQQSAMHLVDAGLSPKAAAAYTSGKRPKDPDVKVTRNQLNVLLLAAHRKSATATEEVAAIRELGKLNGLYEAEKPDVTINIQQNIQKLEVLSDEELLRLAGQSCDLLVNEPLEGEFEEVASEEESE